MAALDREAYRALLKQMYPKQRVRNLCHKKRPFLALLGRNPDVGGDNWKVPLIYGDVAGASAKFSVAQANKESTKQIAFQQEAMEDFALASIKGRVWKASQGNSKAFAVASRTQLDSAFNIAAHSLAVKLFRTGTGSIAQINSTVSGTTLTLTNPRDIHCFKLGMRLNFSSTDGGVLHDGGKTVKVTKINRNTKTGVSGAGSMTVTPDLSTISGLSASDYIYREGDGADGGSNICLTGLQGWLENPASISPGESFFNVDRSADKVLLGGNYLDASSSGNMREVLIEAIRTAEEQGGDPDIAIMNHNIWQRLAMELESTVDRTQEIKVGDVSFRGFTVQGSESEVTCFADRLCPPGEMYVLQKDTWTLYSMGECPEILDMDDLGTFVRESNDNAYELRVGMYPELGCEAPGYNVRVVGLPK